MKKAVLIIIVFSWSLCLGQSQSIDLRKQTKALVCGHRGGFYDQFPENSFAAIDYTVVHCNSSPVVVEVDIRKSKDGSLFILHDESVDRTTTGIGNIADLTDDYLKSLFLKNRDGSLTTERLPTLDSLVAYAKNRNVILMLDIKADVWGEVIAKIMAKNIVHKCIVLTFKPTDSRKVYELSKTVKISCLIRNPADWELINELHIPRENLIAYINTTTSQPLVNQLKNNLMMIMTDMGESVVTNEVLSKKYYMEFLKKRKLNIVITNFPVEVSEKIR